MTTLHRKPDDFNPKSALCTRYPAQGDLPTPRRWRHFLSDSSPLYVHCNVARLDPDDVLRVDFWVLATLVDLGVGRLEVQLRGGRRWRFYYATLRDIFNAGRQVDADGWNWLEFPANILQRTAPRCDWERVLRRIKADEQAALS